MECFSWAQVARTVGLCAAAIGVSAYALANNHHQGTGIVLVHGGSHQTNLISKKLGKPPRFVTSVSGHVSRYTDRETLEIYAMVVSGRVNKLLVERLLETAPARGVSVMYLLTTTAADYFPRFGFEPIPREQADSRLQASEEFRGACPDSAVCMRLRV